MDNKLYILSAGLEFFFALISIVLFIGCLIDHDRKRPANRVMAVILIVHAVMNAVDACVWLWCDEPSLLTLMKVLSFLSYGLASVIFVMFSHLLICYISEHTRVSAWVSRGVMIFGTIMVLTEAVLLASGLHYYWDENGICHPGELYYLCQMFGVVFLVMDIALVLVYRKALRKRDTVVLTLYSVIPLVSFAFIPLWGVVPLYMASTIALMLYYIILHVEHGQRMAEQQTQLARQELELANSRTAIMLSQIQPHFMYNALTAIAQLCEDDPSRAKTTTIQFSEYLRQNMNSLARSELIPFDKELEHVKTYLSIEQVRFGAELRIEYDIRTVAFFIPPLCLQPIVENAVKHGVGMKEDGGTVVISTAELPDGYLLSVCDDGVGFAVGKALDDGRTHIGIQNVMERLYKLIGATMSIESEIGKGTNVTIRIPKKETEQ